MFAPSSVETGGRPDKPLVGCIRALSDLTAGGSKGAARGFLLSCAYRELSVARWFAPLVLCTDTSRDIPPTFLPEPLGDSVLKGSDEPFSVQNEFVFVFSSTTTACSRT